MERAIVLIGVAQTGGLPPLMAVYSGIKKMTDWAASHGGIPDERIAKLSDEGGAKVTAQQVYDTIEGFCDGTLDQLIVYFSGHGTVRGTNEVWLLSGAPNARNEAVDLSESIESARFSNVETVVFISDACRTPATRVKAQNVMGIPVFPNMQRDDEHPVDVFYATGVGHASFEIEIGAVDDGEPDYRATYTEALASALNGEKPEAMDADAEAGFGVIRGRPRLNAFLVKEVATLLTPAAGDKILLQKPVARVLSDDLVLSRFPLGPGVVPGPLPPKGGPVSGTVDPLRQLDDSMRRLLGLDAPEMGAGIGGPADLVVFASAKAAKDAGASCRLVVTGAPVASASARDATVTVEDSRVNVDETPADAPTDLLVGMADGTAFVLPVSPAATAVVAFSAGELRDLVFVPRDGPPQPNDVRGLRGTLAARARLGDLWLDEDEATAAARFAIEEADGDIALSLHVAYALSDLRRYSEHVRGIDDAVRARWGIRLFDLALLTGDLDGRTAGEADVHPSTPLLARGWATARTHRVRFPDALEEIEAHLLPSVWTQFDAEGAAIMASLPLTERIEEDG